MRVLWELGDLGIIPTRITKIDLTVKKRLPDLITVLKTRLMKLQVRRIF